MRWWLISPTRLHQPARPYPGQTCTVLQCAREAGVKRVMYSSTSSAYGFNETPNVETQPDDCLNPYSISKVNGEKLCKMYTDLFGLPTVIFRYFNVYGYRQPLKGQYTPVVGIFMRQRDAGESLTIVGDGEQRRDFTHVSDVVNANVMAAISNPDDDAFGQIYNVGNGVNYSVNELADMISDDQVTIPPRIGESRVTLANNQKIRNTFGWEPKVNLKETNDEVPNLGFSLSNRKLKNTGFEFLYNLDQNIREMIHKWSKQNLIAAAAMHAVPHSRCAPLLARSACSA